MKIRRLRRWQYWCLGILLSLLLLFLFRIPILRGAGNLLIYENELHKTGTLFILSGGAYDRGIEGARLYREGYVKRLVCTGGNEPPDFAVIDSSSKIYESDLTRLELLRQGVPDSVIEVIHQGTSTIEEGDILLHYAQTHHLREIMVLSNKFHTRRVKKFIKKKLEKHGVQVIVRGAASQQYQESRWWKSEYGLLAVNNEYVKLFYYLLK